MMKHAKLPLIWADEFDGQMGTTPNPQNWTYEIGGNGWGNEELQFYTNEAINAHLDGNSNLEIIVNKPDKEIIEYKYAGKEYTSARLISKNLVSTTYGLIEARMKLPTGKGIWSAFWMLGNNIDKNGWPNCGEIDVMENFGKDPLTVQGTIHGPGYPEGITSLYTNTSKLSDNFHIYSIKWKPSKISWYFDRKLYFSKSVLELQDKKWVFDHGYYFLINVAVGGTQSITPDKSVVFPQRLLIDFIRIYK